MIGIFGGSFNPPHVGHIIAVTYALTMGDFEQIIIVPSFSHPFAKELVGYDHRLRMCRIALDSLGSIVKVSDIERELPTPSYMINTLRALQDQFAGEKLRLILGNDCFAERERWHEWEAIEQIAPGFVLSRDTPRQIFPDISSTIIRELLSEGHAINHLVPPAVVEYIYRHGLYQ
jgi:nicotinate-nucleotide adenylyltransferase